mmetsp:Transcript_21753/g.56693  ORF Transcript_21753/g.56693 Transcript_21753/m.56693 type:complete len:385 (+) Transcript_21753:624-1778(+)
MEVDVVHLVLGLQVVVSLADGGAVEGVGLNDVCPAFQVLDVDGLDDVWAGQHQDVIVTLQLIRVVLVAVRTEVSLLQLVSLNHGAHGAVNVRDALAEQLVHLIKDGALLQGLLVGLVLRHGGQVRIRGQGVKVSGLGVDFGAELDSWRARVDLLHSCGVALGLQRSGVLHHALSGVVTPVQQHILNELQQLLVNLLIHILLHLCGVHDAHVHARLACVVQEGRVEATAHSLVAAEAEGDVGHAPADLGARAHALDLPRGADKVHGIVVVLSHAGADGQDIGVKDDILWVEAHFLHQQLVGTLANADLLCAGGGLALLIERHDHHSSPMALDGVGLLQERLHALLQADAVHNALALAALQACLHNGKLGAVDHEGHLADLGVCDQ